MAADSFVHLHLHTEYSLLDGAIRIEELMKKTAELGMPAVAITDHGNLYGAIEFYQQAQRAGIKPIIGCEAYMAPGSLRDRQASSARDAAYHFTLLARDETGYRNLVKLASIAHLDGFYYKPRIDKEVLARHAEGLIGMSACLKGEINVAIQADQLEKARKSAAEFRDIFGRENFFLELHDHGLEAQQKCNRALVKLARELELGLVAANDVHFLERSHHEAHDVMICIGTGAMVHDERRMRYVPELYFKSPVEMAELFREVPEAVLNTLAIAERCNVQLEFGKPKYPSYTPPAGLTQNQYLRQICAEGVCARYDGRAESAEIRERLEREIQVLEEQGFVNYFLIVWDFIRWAKERGIPVGPGRGSAAGSMVAYVIGITDVDPLRFNLLFERFLNPERVSPPDIDIDFCQNRRGEVIEYVRQKYGDRAVSQIVTFGTLGAKSVVRDVGRVLGWSYADADRIARLIPNELNITLNGFEKKSDTGKVEHVSGAIDKNPDLKKAIETEPATAQLWTYATLLEGISRNAGIHAAGVVIGDRDLSDYVPLARGNAGEIISQYSMQPLTDLGMLKMDFLGLKTLTVIRDAELLIRKKVVDFSIDKIPPDDPAAFALLNRAETIGLFQLEGGMTTWCKQFDFKSLDDIIALNALYRPGPMELIGDYIKRKKGQAKIRYMHPLLQKICADTYGVMIYQEQVMAAASELAGYSLGQADLLRRAMGKKDEEKMAKERANFVEGCKRTHGIDEKKANAIFDLLEKFAGYGFNKSHSAAYGWISYQTAYLKANYPVEFMAALLSSEFSNTDKIAVLVSECRRMGIEILPPDVNRSELKFAPESDGRAIRFGLAAIKNVGEAAMEAAVHEREEHGTFASMEDFCSRLDSRKINKKVLESLVRCGAFDFTGCDRAELFAEIDEALLRSAATHRDRAAGQVSLFATGSETAVKRPKRFKVAAWSAAEKLSLEKELLGFYVTGHPLDEHRNALESGGFTKIAELAALGDRATVQVAGAITNLEKKFTKKEGKPFAVVTLEDLSSSVEVMVWSDVYVKTTALLEKGNVIALAARVDRRDERPRVVAESVRPLAPQKPEPLVLHFSRAETTENDLLLVRETMEQFPGSDPVELEFVNGHGKVLRVRPECRVNDLPELRQRLSPWLRSP